MTEAADICFGASGGGAKSSFAKRSRLIKSADFVETRKNGRRYNTRSFTLYVLANGLNEKRLGLSVSSRIGNAVKRNRVKRLLREFFRLNKDKNDIFPESTDVHISVKNAVAINEYRDVEEEIKPLSIKAVKTV